MGQCWPLGRVPGCTAVVVLLVALLMSVAARAGTTPEVARPQPKNFEQWLPLAQAGDAAAQCQVGVAYLNGDRVPQDFAKGLHWLRLSSSSGFGYARYVLADLYSRGYAVPADTEKAYYYAVLAAGSSSLPEKFREKAGKLRDAMAKRLTPAQVTRVQARTALAPLVADDTGF